MPIQDHRTGTTGSCPCCGTLTRKSTGTFLLPGHPAIVYFARWTPDCPGSLIAFLPRDRVIGTPLAPVVFQTLDEIWLHDPELIEFVRSASNGG